MFKNLNLTFEKWEVLLKKAVLFTLTGAGIGTVLFLADKLLMVLFI